MIFFLGEKGRMRGEAVIVNKVQNFGDVDGHVPEGLDATYNAASNERNTSKMENYGFIYFFLSKSEKYWCWKCVYHCKKIDFCLRIKPSLKIPMSLAKAISTIYFGHKVFW